jgi:hypothetical protein
MKIYNLKKFIKEVRQLTKEYGLEIEGVGINKDSIIKCEGSNERLFITLIKKNGTRN